MGWFIETEMSRTCSSWRRSVEELGWGLGLSPQLCRISVYRFLISRVKRSLRPERKEKELKKRRTYVVLFMHKGIETTRVRMSRSRYCELNSV